MLIIAKQNEETVSIKDAKKGEDYECFCCGSKLITKQGKVKTWHFAHANGEDCAGGSETQLHILAKQYFENNTELNVYGQKPMILNITNAQLEQRYLNVIPDVTAEIDGQKVFIEIVVTSKITEEKATKLENYGIPVIIIDLKKFYKILFEKEELYQFINDNVFVYYNFSNMRNIYIKNINDEIKGIEQENFQACKDIEYECKMLLLKKEKAYGIWLDEVCKHDKRYIERIESNYQKWINEQVDKYNLKKIEEEEDGNCRISDLESKKEKVFEFHKRQIEERQNNATWSKSKFEQLKQLKLSPFD